jgi:hypothetical protein
MKMLLSLLAIVLTAGVALWWLAVTPPSPPAKACGACAKRKNVQAVE